MADYADAVLPIIRKTHDMLLPHWGTITRYDKKSGGVVSTVTHLDLEIETFIRNELAERFPDIQFAGDEYGGSRDKERFWLCDPIDGTGRSPFSLSNIPDGFKRTRKV